MVDSLAGKLLVAAPELIDPNFFRTVVLIVEHDDVEGALGLVLNRPSDAEVGDYLPEWAPFTSPPVVHVGGPVTPDVAIGIVDTPVDPPETWAPVIGDIGLFDLSTLPEGVGGVVRARVFAGYAGWVAGQLEAELLLRSWFVVDASPEDVFTEDPEGLWRRVLRRQPGPLSWYADYPPDPAMN
jgi:putative transcriptional regulator